jgi:hypothetical protein
MDAAPTAHTKIRWWNTGRSTRRATRKWRHRASRARKLSIVRASLQRTRSIDDVREEPRCSTCGPSLKHRWEKTKFPKTAVCERCGLFRKTLPSWERDVYGNRIFAEYRFPGQTWSRTRPDCFNPNQAEIDFSFRANEVDALENDAFEEETKELQEKYPTVPEFILKDETLHEVMRLFPGASIKSVKYPRRLLPNDLDDKKPSNDVRDLRPVVDSESAYPTKNQPK